MTGRRRLPPLEGSLAVLGASAVVLAFGFARFGIPPWIPPALSLRFGVPSPFTGLTRSFVAVASGDVAGAFAWHPLGPVAFAVAAAMPVAAAVSVLRGRSATWLATLLSRRSFWALAWTLVAGAWVRQVAVLG